MLSKLVGSLPPTQLVLMELASLKLADKELKYHELVDCAQCLLVLVAIETGGRWSQEVVTFVDSLGRPVPVRPSQ